MSDRIKASLFFQPGHSAPRLVVSDSEPQQEPQLITFASSTDARTMGYGALAFWIVIAVLVAARIAFLDTSRIQPTSSLLGAKAAPGWTTSETPSRKHSDNWLSSPTSRHPSV